MKKATVLSLLVFLLIPTLACAQTGSAAADKDFETRLDSYVRATLGKMPDIPAISIAVVKGDKPIFTRAYGLADREAGIKADTDTLFYIASSTKAYTALAAATFDREGRIKFDDPVTKYTTGVQFANAIPEKVTVRNLLTHTSGLQDFALVHRMAFTGLIDPQEMQVAFAKGMTFSEDRYGKYNYDNLGYNIYGVLLQNNLKMKWQDALQQRVFDPLGLKHTTTYTSRAEAKKWRLAAPYVFDAVSGKIVRSVLPKQDNTMQSAGGIFSSISDIGRWLNVNMNDGRIDGKQVFPAEFMRAAHTGYTKTVRNEPPFIGEGEYGLGWQIGTYRNEKVIYHHGGYAGYNNHFSYLPDKKIAVGIGVNTGGVGRTVMQMIAAYIYDSLLGVENVDADYAKKLDDLVADYSTRKQQAIAAAVERAKRPWLLSKPFPDYAGRYTNELFGTIEITARENGLAVRWGNMNCIATPFTQKESIRVELEPGGNGEIMTFKLNAAGTPETLTYNGITFTRR